MLSERPARVAPSISNGAMSTGFRERLRLSEQERNILASAEFRARATVTEIASACGYKDSTVRYILNKMIEKGVIADRRSYLNPGLLGFTNFAVYISMASWSERDRGALSAFLSKAPRVTWFAEVGGDFQFAVAFGARHVHEFVEFRDQVSKRFARVIAGQAVSIRASLWTFPRKFLAEGMKEVPAWFQGGARRVGVDATDARILSMLGREGFASARVLAERTGIPSSTFDRRIRTLEEKGIILGYYYRVKASAIGFEDFRLLVHSQDVGKDFTARLLAFARAHPNIRKFVQCVADWDYEFEVSVPTAREVSSVIAVLYERFRSELTRVRVVPLFSEVNCSPFPEGWFGPEDAR